MFSPHAETKWKCLVMSNRKTYYINEKDYNKTGLKEKIENDKVSQFHQGGLWAASGPDGSIIEKSDNTINIANIVEIKDLNQTFMVRD